MKQISIRVALIFTVLLLPSAVFAQYNPPNGGEDIADLLSPSFLSGGASVTSLETPFADVLNPAISGAKQRTTLDLSYIGLAGFDSSTSANYGYKGHIVNLGAAAPTRVGVFTLSGQFVFSPFSSIDLGTMGTLHFSFAKDLFPNLLIGAGLNFTLGKNDFFDWGLNMNLGFLHLPGDIGFMKDFRWGVALQGLGKWYAGTSGYTGYPAPFTPVAGMSFLFVKTDAIRAGLLADLGFPSFQNIDLTLGTYLQIKDFIGISISSHFDLREIVESTRAMRSPVPGFGLSFTFKTNIKKDAQFFSERGWNRSEIKTQIAAAPLQDNIWAFGAGANIPLGVIDSTGPEITVNYPEMKYISPNNDGTDDYFIIPIEISDRRYVKGYSLKIYNADGDLVREIKNKEKRPENQGFKNIIDRLTAVKSGIEIPKELRWDGSADDGSMVSDGVYSFVLEAWDDNGNKSESDMRQMVIDDTPPEINVSVQEENKIFSPNGDGNKDTITLKQDGSVEDQWKAEIYAIGGNVVRSFEWDNSAPKTLTWDGKNENGILVADGVYGYKITSTDRAGNKSVKTVDNIIINTQATPISLTIDNSFIAPGDPTHSGAISEVKFSPGIPITSGIEKWNLIIKNLSGKEFKRFSGTSAVPSEIVYDGTDENGRTIPEGEYSGTIEVLYKNGNNPNQESPVFTVDVTPPFATVTASYPVFSPNGDGNKDNIIFIQEASQEDIWFGRLQDLSGKVIKTFTWVKRPDTKVSWDGYTNQGTLAPDGDYSYTLEAIDKAGNKGSSKPYHFRLDTENTELLLSTDKASFSPNADGVNDTLEIKPKLQKNNEIVKYVLKIINKNDRTVKMIEGRGSVQPSFIWDGLDDSGSRVEDGIYKAEMEITYVNGNNPKSQTRFFSVDTTYPKIDVSVDSKLFSPDGDGKKDTITISQTGSVEDIWRGIISSVNGQKVKEMLWHGAPETFTWDGTDEAGNQVPDGIYMYKVSSEDEAGNKTEKEIGSIKIDTRPANIFITVDKKGFSPNGDGYLDTIQFKTIVNLKDGIKSWKLDLVHEAGTVEKTFGGEGVPDEEIQWDGRGDGGLIREGTYTAVFSVLYNKGNNPEVKSQQFILDISAPNVLVSMGPKPFSPDNDGVNDELTIGMSVQDASAIDTWTLNIFDPKGKKFYEFSGSGRPADKIIWDGRSLDGELVMAAEDYSWQLTIKDVLGNVSKQNGTIPIDVLVIREGDKLKIRISSITFEPNSPNLVINDSVNGKKNQKVLERLAEILNKYKNYQIRIEGHAVSVYWYNAAKAAQEEKNELQPLSEKRAESVKEALVNRGIDPKRISTVGRGGTEPIVPFSDEENRWKNRRVEFILIK